MSGLFLRASCQRRRHLPFETSKQRDHYNALRFISSLCACKQKSDGEEQEGQTCINTLLYMLTARRKSKMHLNWIHYAEQTGDTILAKSNFGLVQTPVWSNLEVHFSFSNVRSISYNGVLWIFHDVSNNKGRRSFNNFCCCCCCCTLRFRDLQQELFPLLSVNTYIS